MRHILGVKCPGHSRSCGHDHVAFIDQRLVSHPGIRWKIEIYLHPGQGWFFQHFHGEWRGRKSIGSKKEIGVIRYII